eukprot:365322-Chlamydomonas_euryale.AAC.4
MRAGLSSFQPPSDASHKALVDGKGATIKGKRLAVEKLLVPATLKLSVLLVRARRGAWARMGAHGGARGRMGEWRPLVPATLK